MMNVTKVRYNTDRKTVYFEAFLTSPPSPLPKTSDDVEELQDGYDFEAGSYFFCVGTDASNAGVLLMANEDGDFIEQ